MTDEITVTANFHLLIDINGIDIFTPEKKGLSILFELQKSLHFEKDISLVKIYVNFLFQNGATYLALFIMKKFSVFNFEASNLAIENSISINSKVN